MTRARSAQESAALILAAQRAAPLLLIRAIKAARDGQSVVRISTDELREVALQLGLVADIAERSHVLEFNGRRDG